MKILIGLIILSSVFFAVACLAAWSAPGTWRRRTAIAAAALLGILVPLQAFLTWTASVLCLSMPARPRPAAFSWAAGLAMVLSYAVYLWNRVPDLLLAAELRRTYPLESISRRLDYEVPYRQRAADSYPDMFADTLNPSVRQRMERFEDKPFDEKDRRRFFLQSLHESTRDEFTLSPGFGVTRTTPLSSVQRYLELPEVPAIPVCPDEMPISWPSVAPTSTSQPIEINEFLSLHDAGRDDFLETARMAYIRDREHVSGFEPHRFSQPLPVIHPQPKSGSWQVVRLELVSLLTHDSPVVYESAHLPRMEELRNAPIRPLNEFETESLAKLRTDEDVVIDESSDRIRMVGSLRAAKNCLGCHSVSRGELLGALTYELKPEGNSRK